ncbi:MAG: family 78 glycoside hydrolase catalytic domain, partial [Candidatus Latescibacterota bacterium]
MATLMMAAVVISGLRTEYRVNPIGIDAMRPRLSWRLVVPDRMGDRLLDSSLTGNDQRGGRDESIRNVFQTAYRIQVATDPARFESDPVWDSGRVESDQSVQLPYGGPRLESRKRYYWRVRIWDGSGQASDWSEPAYWEMGLLDVAEWVGEWISPTWEEDLTEPQPAPLLRHEFVAAGDVRRARLYVTSLGLYEMHLNGDVVGDAVLTPGWTSYDHRLQYQTYDVTNQVRAGANTIGAWLGDGWYRGFLRWDLKRNVYGDRLALLAQLEIEYSDGTSEVIATGDTWQAATGAILMSDIYMGEIYDARLEGQEDWSPAEIVDHPKSMLVAASSPPVRRMREIRPVEILESPEGNPVVDLGQNMVGRVRFRLKAAEGTTITLRHAEVLNPDGSLYTDNLRYARQEVQYTSAGRPEEVYEPKFTFQGFRYVEVEGWPGELNAGDIVGIVLHSDLEQTGHFETSNELINQLQQNIVWGQRGNFVDVPTDCPQRDERLGWTGDAQVFAPTAAFNMQVPGFFEKWLKDLAADQLDNGSVPWVIPDVLVGDEISNDSNSSEEGSFGHGATGWGDAAVVVPWVMYETYGDEKVLADQFDSMKRWIEFMRRRAGDDLIWDGDNHFGDWLAFAPASPGYP